MLNSTTLTTAVSANDIAAVGTAQVTVVNGSPGGGTSNALTFTIVPAATVPAVRVPPVASFGLPAQPSAPIGPPMRFFGWKRAQQQGAEYLQHFSRPRRGLAGPAPNPALDGPLGSAVAHAGGTPSPLPGLELRPPLPADFLPTAVVPGDFNGDGILDWAIANGGSSNIWIYLGKGDGTFQSATVVWLTGVSPVDLKAASLRGNGVLDLIVAEADSGTVGVLLGNGNGTFGPETQYYMPGLPTALAVGDFDGDGHLDIVAGVASSGISGPLATLLGTGSGAFGDPVFDVLGPLDSVFAQSIVAADFEKTGKLDIVLSDPTSSGGVSLYSNAGAGHFKIGQYLTFNLTGPTAGPVTAGDINEDGCPDVVMLDALTLVERFTGNCDGTFQAMPLSIAESDAGWQPALADVNGDGHLDLLYTGLPLNTGGYGQTSGALLSVHFGDGKGGFALPKVYRGGLGAFSLAVADFNHDGHPDVLAANQDDDSATMFLNDGAGGFGTPQGEYIGYTQGVPVGTLNAAGASVFAVEDLNGDGKPDLALIEFARNYPQPYQLTTMLNDGTGKFQPASRTGVVDGTLNFWDFKFGDFRKTGRPDFIVVGPDPNGGSYLSFSANQGNGTFGTAFATKQMNASGALGIGDFDHDGNLDFVSASATGVSPNPTGVRLAFFRGAGNGTFTEQAPQDFLTDSPGHWPAGIWVGDVNGDGKLDLLVWLYLNQVPYRGNDLLEFLGNGDGTFAAPKIVLSNLSSPTLIDVNHDGVLDVIESRDGSSFDVDSILPTSFTIYLGQPDGTFAKGNTYSPYGGMSSPNLGGSGNLGGTGFRPWIGDFNGDGNIDLAAIQFSYGLTERNTWVQFLLGNGDGTFTPTYDVFDLGQTIPTTAADLNGDGKADFVELDGFTSSFHVVPAQTGPSFQAALMADPVVGTTGRIRITLDVASATATSVTLSTSDPAIVIPSTISVPAGALTQDVNFQIGSAFNPSHVFYIRAVSGATTATMYGTQVIGGNYGFQFSTTWTQETAIAGFSSSNYEAGVSSINGYMGVVNLTCQGLPAGATCQFGSTSVSVPPGQAVSTSFVIATSASTPLGTYSITVSASDPGTTKTTTVTLIVATPTYTVSISPASITTLAQQTATYSLFISGSNNAETFTTSCSGLPQPAVCSIESGAGIGFMPVQIQSNTLPQGIYPFTVTVSDGVRTQIATAQFAIGDFSANLSSTSLTVNVGQTGNVQVVVQGLNGFSDPVTLNCTTPSGAICTFSPAVVNPSTSGTSATLQISVTSRPALVSPSHVQVNRSLKMLLVASATVVCVICFIPGLHWKKIRLILATLMVAALISCGGGAGNGGTGSGGGGGGGGGGGSGGGGGGGSSTSFPVAVQASCDGLTKSVGTVTVTVP